MSIKEINNTGFYYWQLLKPEKPKKKFGFYDFEDLVLGVVEAKDIYKAFEKFHKKYPIYFEDIAYVLEMDCVFINPNVEVK